MRLGDLDELKADFKERNIWSKDIVDAIDNAPTVVVDNCGKCPYYADDDRNIIAEAFNDGYNTAREKFERPKGEWKFNEHGSFYCSVCNGEPYDQYATTAFCPFCGADLRKGGTE